MKESDGFLISSVDRWHYVRLVHRHLGTAIIYGCTDGIKGYYFVQTGKAGKKIIISGG